MTQEDKYLLLKDLCARLPYKVKVNISASKEYDNYIPSINDATVTTLDLRNERCNFKEFYWDKEIVNVRPYLRSISSMTEEEQKEFVLFHCVTLCSIVIYEMLTMDNESDMFGWLNAHHFDYRGLIKKGLALEAPEGMYNI